MKKKYFLIIIAAAIIISAFVLRINQISNSHIIEDANQNLVNIVNKQNGNTPDSDIIANSMLVGNDKDDYGCIPSAGYSWCESKEKCLRIWEEDCPLELQEEDSIKAPVEVVVVSPLPGDVVTSPLEVKGRALGNWFFEAILPLKLITDSGELIVDHYAQAESDWMSEDFVPFTGVLEFSTEASSGYLIVNKNNASGPWEHDAQISIPIKFNN
jgi:hypothetical protein